MLKVATIKNATHCFLLSGVQSDWQTEEQADGRTKREKESESESEGERDGDKASTIETFIIKILHFRASFFSFFSLKSECKQIIKLHERKTLQAKCELN